MIRQGLKFAEVVVEDAEENIVGIVDRLGIEELEPGAIGSPTNQQVPADPRGEDLDLVAMISVV